MNNRKLAAEIATSETYAGGYIFPGTHVEYSRPDISGKNHLLPQLQNRVHFVNEYDFTPDQPRAAWNKRILSSLPVGSMVYFHWSWDDSLGGQVFQKVGICRWRLSDA